MGSQAPKEVVHHVHPSGWEADPEEERFKLSLFDPIILVVYCHFALYLRLDDDSPDARDKIARILRQGLARTLSQVRHLCGKLEKDPEGGFSFVKKRETTVKFVVKTLDGPEFPSIDDIEKASFSCSSLRDLKAFSLADRESLVPFFFPRLFSCVSLFYIPFWIVSGIALRLHRPDGPCFSWLLCNPQHVRAPSSALEILPPSHLHRSLLSPPPTHSHQIPLSGLARPQALGRDDTKLTKSGPTHRARNHTVPYGEGRPESNPNNSPTISGFQLNFVRGGAVLSSHVHHWATDVVGWSNFARQLADNCRALHAATSGAGVVAADEREEAALLASSATVRWPSWDPASIDVSRFTRAAPPADQLVDGPPVVPRHPGHPREQQALLFHLPRSRAEKIKAMAQPDPAASSGSSDMPSWVSTYDAMCAFIWRHLTRARLAYYKPDLDGPMPWFGESVDMRPRFREPAPTPPRMIRNMLAGAFSEVATHVAMPTVREVSSGEAPLSRVAQYIRQMTDSVTQQSVEGLLEYIRTLRDQQSVSFNLMSKPPMSFFVTDHRPADVSSCDFGFGSPLTHRFLTGDDISANMTLVYPATRRSNEPGSDEGTIWSITMEKDVVPALLKDPEWCEFFEYRGLD